VAGRRAFSVLASSLVGLLLVLVFGPVRADRTADVPPAAAPPANPAAVPLGNPGSGPRNVVVILTDDQPERTLAGMPHLQSDLVAKGVTFTNAVVSNPLCCPSRATLLTGLYAHETGVWDNSARYGGWSHFVPWEPFTIAVRLHDAGYTTAFLGKYVNGYGVESNPPVPPGWDRWFAFVPSGAANYFDYTLNVDGTLQRRGHEPEDYSTDVLAAEAERFIRGADGPFFLVIATYAPHQPFVAAPRHAGAPVAVELGPAYNEADMSDKPRWARRLQPVHAEAQAVAQVQMLMAVDDLVGRVTRALEERGRLADTAVIYTSDNGLAWGEHRWLWKSAPWEESIGVPLVVRADGVTARGHNGDLVANTDIAPTIAELAGLPPLPADGRSLAPLLRGERPLEWRTYVTLESLRFRPSRAPLAQIPSYCGLRARSLTYVQYATGEEELYDLRADPWQLQNLAVEPEEAGRIRRLRRAALERCRPLPPLPEGWRLLRPRKDLAGPGAPPRT